MDQDRLRELLEDVRAGRLGLDSALERLRHLPFEDLGFAKLDHHRHLRCGMPEVIFCAGKTPPQAAEIAHRMLESGTSVMATRASQAHWDALRGLCPNARHFETARIVLLGGPPPAEAAAGLVLVVTAGTSDLPVAEEALVTSQVLGNRTEIISDVGVAGIHRLFAHSERLREARAIIVVAGMEGALPSVVAGLVACPIVAVPTSVGYGANFGGIAPLLTMLNSCAAGVAVVNIDNGFGAGCMASRINQPTPPAPAREDAP
jgi:NCAIR mutase (PurE)-related protein